MLKVGETTNAKVSLITAEGCSYGSPNFTFKAVDKNGDESTLLHKITGGNRPFPNAPSNSIWEATELGSVKLVAYSYGEGVCQPDLTTPAPFFNANASGSSKEILIVDSIYESFLPVIYLGP